MPTQSLPAPSLRTAICLPAGMPTWAGNPLIYRTLCAISVAGSIFLPALREARGSAVGLATATTSKGRGSGRSATTAPAASIRRSSLKAGIVAPSVMLRKLAAYRRQNQLDLALQELGRIERTLFMLDWLESPELRRRCHAGLNKSEQRHFLAQVICTFKQGRIADRSAEAQQFRASGLNLVIAAIVFWNSTYIADAIAHLRATEQSVPDAWLAHTSPLSWEHISFSGDFLWERAAATADKRRPLNLGQTRVAA
jgi:hypothetical protein